MLVTLALLVLPFLTPTEQATRDDILQQGGQNADTPRASEKAIESPGEAAETAGIFGAMTLREIQDKTSVPYEHILAKLGLPEDIHPDEKLGRLRRTYAFSIDDVHKMVKEYKQ